MIASPQNEKLKLVRKLRERKHREREELFVTEGEDLVEAGLAAGAEPRLVLCAAGSGLDGEEVDPGLLTEVSTLGSGTRAIAVWSQRWAESPQSPCVYLHAVADPGNVGAIVRTAHALLGGSVVLGPDCADPHSPKAVRASMGSIFAQPLVRAGRRGDAAAAGRPCRPRWRRAGGAGRRADALPRRRARRPPRRCAARMRPADDDSAPSGIGRVAQRRRRGGNRLRAAIVARHAQGGARCLSGSRRSARRPPLR